MDKIKIKEELIAQREKVLREKGAMNGSRILNRVMRRLDAFSCQGGEGAFSEWICDNKYFINKCALELQRKKIALPCRSIQGAMELLSACDFVLNKDAIDTLFEVYCFEDGLNDVEIRRLPEALVFALLLVIEQACIASQGPAKELITSLHYVKNIDFSDWILGFSPLERLFRQDPSGVYPNMDRMSQEIYRKHLYRYAKKHKLSPVAALEELLSLCSKKGCGLGELLMKKPNYPWLSSVSMLLFALFLLLSLGLLYRKGNWVATIVCLLVLVPSLYRCSIFLIQYLASVFLPQTSILKMKVEACPDEARTCVCITGMTSSAQEAKEYFDRLERFYLSQYPAGKRDANVYFGLIADLGVSKKMHQSEDRVIREQICQCCRDLNEKYGGGFFGYLREREYAPGEDCYCGKERKRGAILEFARDVSGALTGKRLMGDSLDGGNLRYLITLDGDTTLGFRQIYRLIGAMLHPLNRPVISVVHGQAVVTKGHGILQPAMGTSLNSSSRSPLSVLFSGAGGREPYHGSSFDFFQDGFGVGMFCGKGIIDLKAYVEVCGFAFPDGEVLSHDILEGSRLRCGFLREETFTDGIPSDAISLRSRKHRWIRGDTQALAFAGNKVKDAKGISRSNPVERVFRFALVDNWIADLLPFHILFSVVVGLVLNGAMAWRLAMLAILPLILPLVLDLLTAILGREWQKISGRYFSRVLGGIWLSFLHFLYQCVAMASDGISALDAALRSLWRMKVSRRKLLEWTTFARLKSSDGFLAHWKKNLPGFLLGAALLVIGVDRPARLFGFLWVTYPLVSYWVSSPYKTRKRIPQKHQEKLKKYIRDSFSFFEANVNQKGNFLPPDNISLSPCQSVAYRCSPTNVGLYLLSLLAARDDQLITSAQMLKSMDRTLSTVERLDKYKGNLYNWYDTTTCQILGKPYVSTVDSGNLCVSLVALAEGLREYCFEAPLVSSLIRRVEHLIKQMQFDFLYDSKRRLFYIGYDCEKEKADENHYDLYMSEARMTSLYCVAKGIVPASHWQSLQRTLLKNKRYIASASWTGTCFEYFMPGLILPVYRNSFESESLHFAFKEQQRFHWGKKKLFGVSESGFFAFDSDMNYQYRAFGVPNLRLKRETDNTMVVSPYSSFLMLRADPEAVLSNLEQLKRHGMYGKHGFYEALDCAPSRTGGSAIVKSYMTHHVGMSILAASNLLHGDHFVNRFCREPSIAASLVLLEEKIPVDAVVLKKKEDWLAKERGGRKLRTSPSRRINGRREYYLYPGKESSLVISSGGDNSFSFLAGNRRILFHRPLRIGEEGGLIVRLTLGEQTYSNRVGENPEGSVISTYCHEEGFDYAIRRGNVLVRIRFMLLPYEGSPLGIEIYVSGYCGMAKALVECHPALCEKERYNSHPAFSELFLQIAPQKEENAIMLLRRPRGEEEEVCAFLGFENSDGAENTFCFGEPLSFEKERLLTGEKEPMAMLYSHLAVIQRKMLYPVSSTPAFSFGLCCSTDRQGARDSYRKITSERKRGQSKGARSFRTLYHPYSVGTVRKMENELLQTCLYENRGKLKQSGVSYPLDRLWSYGISGDVPMVAVDFSLVEKEALEALLHRKRIHFLSGIWYDLIVIVKKDGYRREEFDRFAKGVYQSKTGFLLGKKGGIHPVDDSEQTKLMFSDLADLFWTDQVVGRGKEELCKCEPCNNEHGHSDGRFCPQGFLMEQKSLLFPPWSHVLSAPSGGSLVTDRDLGYTWWTNSALKRITRWNNHAFGEHSSESLMLSFSDGKNYDLIRCCENVGYFAGEARYSGCVRGVSYTIWVGVDPRYCHKRVRIQLKTSRPLEVRLGYRIVPVLGGRGDYPSFIKVEKIDGGASFQRLLYENDFKGSGFLVLKGGRKEREVKLYRDSSLGVWGKLFLESEQSEQFEFLLGAYHSYQQLLSILEDEKASSPKDYVRGILTEKNCTKKEDGFYPFWLSYQTVFGRSMAKTGFYQSGGAFGFRDQLQDSLAYLSFSPEKTKMILIRCAAHQFEEGDVLHWWHNLGPAPHRGVRSRCSDDYLWLLWVLCEYLETSGDRSILEIPIPFLHGEMLKESQAECYGAYSFTHLKYPMVEHVRRACDLFWNRGFGPHGLPFMGSGDWNDGMSLVGREGGESVWLGMFSVMVFSKLARLCVLSQRENHRLMQGCQEMMDALDRCYNGRWYPRAYFANGQALGSDLSLESECSLDLLPQAFSVLLYESAHEFRTELRKERMISACQNARKFLFCQKEGVLRLFRDSFRFHEPNPGYIRSYADGVRENGGQYTHGAVWFCWALYYLTKHVPERKEAYRQELNSILQRLCPCEYVGNKEELLRYKNEPYVLSGDVYWTSNAKGRGGWSWYTGAAGWLYRLLDAMEKDENAANAP